MPALNPSPGIKHHRRTHGEASTNKKKRKFDEPLAHKVVSEFAQIEALLLNLQPGLPPAAAVTAVSELQTYSEDDAVASLLYVATQHDEDALSIAASGNFFSDKEAAEQEELEKESLGDRFSWVRGRFVEGVR